jgi:hypothetical protein
VVDAGDEGKASEPGFFTCGWSRGRRPNRSHCRVGWGTMIAVGTLFAGSLRGQTPTMRDSAGIRIVENPSRSTAPVAFRFGARTLDLGGPANNPDDEFMRGLAKAGLRLPDGTVAVPDVSRIHFFDAKGLRLSILGRLGAGPAEFRSINAAEFCRTRGDTLIAGDYRNGRFAIIHHNRVVRTTSYRDFGSAVVGCFGDGTVLMQGGLPGSAPTYVVRLRRVSLDGSLVAEFDDLVYRVPSSLTHNVRVAVRTVGQRVFVGDGATSEIRVYDSNGKLVEIVRTNDKPRRIAAAEAERSQGAQTQGVNAPSRPSTYPTYHNFRLDPEGRLWVQDFIDEPNSGRWWTAFDAQGRLIGRLEVPSLGGMAPPTVAGFGVNEVQVARVDADGFVHISFYQLVRDN